MKRKKAVLFFAILGLAAGSAAQFTPEELAEREKWEEFLETAKIVNRGSGEPQQLESREAVTSPWILTLEKDGVTKRALWKNPRGRMHGFVENWKWEIAAYRMDKHLGLNMVPPTVEKRFQGNRGSCQLWVEDTMTMKHKEDNDIETPPAKIYSFNNCVFLQRAFDNLIANEDRHLNQILITEDWRLLLIDHSRSFRTQKKFTTKLIYDEKHKEGQRLMKALPRSFYANMKALEAGTIREVVGEYLTDKEIEAVLLRRDLIVEWVEKRIEELGEAQVLYGLPKNPSAAPQKPDI
jgi:hypothetical protein